MIHAGYYFADGAPLDGDTLATTLGWFHWSNWVVTRARQYPETAHLAGFGWLEGADSLAESEHEVSQMLHAVSDSNLSAIAANVLAALKARPANTLGILATDGEPGEESGTPHAESIFREDLGPPPFPGAVFDKTKHRWVNPRTGEEHEPAKHNASELHPDDTSAVVDGIDRYLADVPDEEKPPAGLIAKAKDLALTVLAKAAVWATRLSPAALRIGAVLSEVLDVPSDLKKFAYNPTLAGGQENAALANNDFVKANMTAALGFGVSGHLVASLSAQVLSRLFFWLKRKAAGEAVETGDGFAEWADMLAQLYAHVAAELGLEGMTPDAAAIEKGLRSLLTGKV